MAEIEAGVPFPAGAGMNRQSRRIGELCHPFPAGAGMNRLSPSRKIGGAAVPRRRGDEPGTEQAIRAKTARSPQARG